MDHIVYTDAKAKEMEALLSGDKTMIIRGATGRKLPYGRVQTDDILYFINNNAEGEVKAKAKVAAVLNSEQMTPDQSTALVKKKAQFKKWAGKRYIVLITVAGTEKVKSFPIDKSQYGNMDDWLPVEKIDNVKK
jgi:hypothetical protein